MTKKKRNHSQNIPNDYLKNYMRIIAVMLFFILFIVANKKEDNKEIQLTTNIKFQNRIECSYNDTVNGTIEEGFIGFLDYSDVYAFKELIGINFNSCREIQETPLFI